ncbi:MAG: DUF5677 domain-containing protein [Longimicrobiales bacterium]
MNSEIAAIDRTQVDEEALLAATSEQEHLRVAYDLTREGTSLIGIVASITEKPGSYWSAEEAVVGGQMVRVFRLLRALLEQVRADRAEIAWVISRMIVETVISVRYLLAHGDTEVVRSYLHQSLQHEVQLQKTITANIAARGGEVLPIEQRMLKSIQRDFARSGVNPKDIPTNKIRNWGGKTLFDKAKELGEEQAYLSLFGGPSRNVHGNWHDLLQHSLRYVDGCGFRPRLEDRPLRPHLLHADAILSIEAAQAYVGTFNEQASEALRNRLTELLERVHRANDIHEEWLSPERVAERQGARNGS